MARKIAETPILTDTDASDFIKKIKANEKSLAKSKKKLETSEVTIAPKPKITIKTHPIKSTIPIEKIKEAVKATCEESKKEKNKISKEDYTMIFRDHAIAMSKLGFPDLNFMYKGLAKKQPIFPPIDDTVEFTTNTSTTEPLFKTFSMEEVEQRWEERRKRDSKFPRNVYVYFCRKFWGTYHKIKDFPYEIKYFIQRGRRGYSDRDLWSYDHFLADIIGNGLKQLAKTTHGWPDSKFETFEEWQAELNKISDAFLDYIDENSDINFDGCKTDKDRKKAMAEYVKKCKERKKILMKVIDHFECLWD